MKCFKCGAEACSSVSNTDRVIYLCKTHYLEYIKNRDKFLNTE